MPGVNFAQQPGLMAYNSGIAAASTPLSQQGLISYDSNIATAMPSTQEGMIKANASNSFSSSPALSSLGSSPFTSVFGTSDSAPTAAVIIEEETFSFFNSCQAQMSAWAVLELGPADVQRGKLLGEGASGKVYAGRMTNVEAGVAIKAFKVFNEDRFNSAMQEIKLMSSLEHPCTVRMLGWTRTPFQVSSIRDAD